MSPRIDHRPPLIAFAFLLVLAIAVIGTSARAGDGLVVSGGPLEVRTSVSGTTSAARPGPAERVAPVSRSQSRPLTTGRAPTAGQHTIRQREPKADKPLAAGIRTALGRQDDLGHQVKHLGKELRLRLGQRLLAKPTQR